MVPRPSLSKEMIALAEPPLLTAYRTITPSLHSDMTLKRAETTEWRFRFLFANCNSPLLKFGRLCGLKQMDHPQGRDLAAMEVRRNGMILRRSKLIFSKSSSACLKDVGRAFDRVRESIIGTAEEAQP